MGDKTMQYHEMAAFIFLLFLVAENRETGGLFNDFEDQLKSLPERMPLPLEDFHRIVTGIRDVIATGSQDPRHDRYVALFKAAHEGIRDVLKAMEADALWDVCRPADFEKVKSIALLTLSDVETRRQ